MLDNSHKSLTEAILQTVAYSDIFDYPLTAHEIYRYLTGINASFETVNRVLQNGDYLTHTGIYFTLPRREEIIPIRLQREARSRKLMPHALRYGRILGSLPFIRMVALTGSLAVMNVSGNVDFDYMLIAAPGRVWTARAFALLLNRTVKLWGHAICPNLILSENALEWKQHDLYIARELCQMIPIAGINVYQRLMHANEWAKNFLPNAFMKSNSSSRLQDVLLDSQKRASVLQEVLEFPLCGKFGDRFERWEMDRKIERFSRQEGFGEETAFNADVCQGNFDHHNKRAREAFESKLSALAIVSGGGSVRYPSLETTIGANKT